MILLGNILIGLAQLLDACLSIVIFLVIARVVLSWVGADPYNQLVRIVIVYTEMVLRPIRRWIPPIGPGIDLSPIVLFLLISLVKVVIVQSIGEYGFAIKLAATRG
jgi:YggT family protein